MMDTRVQDIHFTSPAHVLKEIEEMRVKGGSPFGRAAAWAFLLAMKQEPIFQIGKASLTPEVTQAVAEALQARELIKISVLQNCMDDPREIAEALA